MTVKVITTINAVGGRLDLKMDIDDSEIEYPFERDAAMCVMAGGLEKLASISGSDGNQNECENTD